MTLFTAIFAVALFSSGLVTKYIALGREPDPQSYGLVTESMVLDLYLSMMFMVAGFGVLLVGYIGLARSFRNELKTQPPNEAPTVRGSR